mmetsp:Transcript_17236/g.30224  ORF Transcript_17236/g.30224 Transcript_17236/m.30224 type:complete len:123 (-) Transcript_17236:958-1326(-)
MQESFTDRDCCTVQTALPMAYACSRPRHNVPTQKRQTSITAHRGAACSNPWTHISPDDRSILPSAPALMNLNGFAGTKSPDTSPARNTSMPSTTKFFTWAPCEKSTFPRSTQNTLGLVTSSK